MASATIKFVNNGAATPTIFTAEKIAANGQETPVTSLPNYSSSSAAGKTITQIELLNAVGGAQTLQVKTDGAGKNDKQAKSNAMNVINYDQPININSLRIVLTKQ